MSDNKKPAPTTKKEKKLNEDQFRKLVQQMVRKSIKEHVIALNKTDKTPAPVAKQPRRLTVVELREMVRDTILEALEEKLKAKKAK